jgi:subfamily B ATP-binding cassette protein HlyB/CyaB
MHSARMRDSHAIRDQPDCDDHSDRTDSGLTSLIIIAHFHGIPANLEQLRHQSGLSSATGRFSESDLLLAAKSLDLKATRAHLRAERLAKVPLPALMLDREHRHFILARVSEDGNALIQEGSASSPTVIRQSEVIDRSEGRALLFASRASVAGDLMRFDFC